MKPQPSELSIAGSDISAGFSISSQIGGTTSSQVGLLTCFTTLGLSLHIFLLKNAPVALYFLRISLAVEILILRVFATFAMGSPYFSTFSTKFCLLYVSKCLPSSIFWYTFYGMSHNLSISSSQSINLLLLIAQTLPFKTILIPEKGCSPSHSHPHMQKPLAARDNCHCDCFALSWPQILKLKMDQLRRYLATRQTIWTWIVAL